MSAIATRPDPVRALRALVGYTFRSTLPTRRWFAALLPAAMSVIFGLLATTYDEAADYAFTGVAADSLFLLVLPVTCLIIGDAVLGAEVRSGTFVFTWMSPVPTWLITIARWLGGTLASAIVLGAAFALAAVVAGAPELAGAAAISAACGSAAYVAIFLAFGCITKRAAVWSLAFVFLVELLLGGQLAGIAQLSPTWMARAAFIGLADVRVDLVRDGIPSGTGALVRLLVLAAIGLFLVSWRLRTLRLSGSAD